MRKHSSVDSKGAIVLLFIATCIVAVSCGGTEPSVPDLTASILTLVFTGDSSRISSDFIAGDLPEAQSFFANEASDCSKGICEISATWTICPESSFESYILYRSETPGISNSPSSAEVLVVFSERNVSMYIDADVDWASQYYYALRTSDAENNSVWSNEAQIVTPDSSWGEVTLPEGMEFVSIPPGSFEMGAPVGEAGSQSYERPVHTVTFNYSFEMMTTEVTQGMWLEVMGNNPAHFTGNLDRPVETVSWNDCQEFVEAMNALDPEHEYRLPSEAEWEYCCRAMTTTRFYWGNDPYFEFIFEYAWWQGNSKGTSHPVAGKIPNDWGLYDMSGNVWEWCEDFWHVSYIGAPTDGSPWLEPSSANRVIRGGTWKHYAYYCRSACRSLSSPDYGLNALGVRLARSAR